MRVRFCFILLMFLLYCGNAYADDISMPNSQVEILQKYRSSAKLYTQNFVLIGNQATFRVFTTPNTPVKLVLDYGSFTENQTYEEESNANGVAIFSVKILDNEDLIGKSVGVDAFILDKTTKKVVQKAMMQTETGTPSQSNRVYIVSKDSDKGFYFSPIQGMNSVMMNMDYDEHSGYNPALNQMYSDTTPVFIRNMRDAQDNVRQIPTNNNSTN